MYFYKFIDDLIWIFAFIRYTSCVSSQSYLKNMQEIILMKLLKEKLFACVYGGVKKVKEQVAKNNDGIAYRRIHCILTRYFEMFF